ncbi:AGAP010727-PA-like protein [Anopheles sinensis]|uniref:AGAP010727-PA-like protein n=1 Tax=Anopheles sinensis TaxID=74873 RepID=A0A084V9Y9_ANOSI|nr:AGAP010727-PA-like protein [Anopheles sinensis]
MVSSNYIKSALLVALVALYAVHAVPAEENSGKPVDVTLTETTVPPTTPTTVTPPTPTPVPHCKRFDAFSFIGGMILAYGSLAISLVLYKFYKTHWNSPASNNGNYRTL